MKTKFENFISITSNAITDDLCSEYVKWFDAVSENNLTVSSFEQSGTRVIDRKDKSVIVPIDLPEYMFPTKFSGELWGNLNNSIREYYTEYDIGTQMTSYSYKVHRFRPSSGYHVWHHEHNFFYSQRILAWHLTLEAPKRGGETEFLFQSMRIEPEVGKLLIWPAGFTHKHRGNPPLEGQKTYMTGWFDLINPSQN